MTFLYPRPSPFFIQLKINTHKTKRQRNGLALTFSIHSKQHFQGVMPVEVDTSVRIYDDFLRLFFLHAHREASVLANDIPEESGHFRFLRAACLANIKGSVGLILSKTSVMRISIPLYLSSRPFVPPPCFLRSRRSTTLLTPSLVFSPLHS